MIGLPENMTEGAGLLVGVEVHHVQELRHLKNKTYKKEKKEGRGMYKEKKKNKREFC